VGRCSEEKGQGAWPSVLTQIDFAITLHLECLPLASEAVINAKGLHMEEKKPKIQIQIPETMEFKTEYDPEYRIIGCNGIFGGLTLRGDLKMDFFEECQAIPDRIKNKVKPNGEVGEEIERIPPAHTIRLMRVSVLIPPNQIPSIIEWLKEKQAILDQVKALFEGKEDNIHAESGTE